MEILELGMRRAELRQSELLARDVGCWRFNQQVIVHVAEDLVFLQSHFKRVPIARMIVIAWFLPQHCPGVDVGPFEPAEAQLASTRVKSVMFIFAIAVKDESGGARLVVQLDGYRQLIRQL